MRAVSPLLALVLAVVAGVPGLGGPTTASAAGRTAVGTGSISGTVTAPAGADITQVVVEVGRADHSGAAGSAWVAADGAYTVGGLAEGRYNVTFTGWGAGLVREVWNDQPLLEQASVVVVGSGAVTGIDASLVLGATVSGTIHANGGFDVTGVKVYLHGAPGQPIPPGVVLPDGRWSARGIPTGTFMVEFEGRGVCLSREYWNGLGSPDGVSWLAVTVGETRTGVDMTLNGPVITEPIKAYVTKVFDDLLGRGPDIVGLGSWSCALASGRPFGEVANGITFSDEYRARLIADSYATYLGRGPDRSGAAGWLSAMRSGLTIQQMEAGFIGSAEYYAAAGGTDADWVARLYLHVLGRPAADTEIQAWVAALARGASRSQVSMGFLVSYEHLSDVVDAYYRDLLRRGIDPTGNRDWVIAIQGGVRVEAVIAGIVASPEYRANA